MTDFVSDDYVSRVCHGVWQTLASQAYVEWSEWPTDLLGSGLDGGFREAMDFVPDDLREQVEDFLQGNAETLALIEEMYGRDAVDPGRVGQDFVLTRNGEGAGFWDRGYGELGDVLTKNVQPYGEVYLMISGSEDDWRPEGMQICC
jgi:hypothetical protein